MNVAILGFDTEGRASYEYFRAQGHNLTICDKKTSIDAPNGAPTQLGDNYLEKLDRFDLLVRTPGLHPQAIIDANNADILSKVTSGTNEFFRICPTKNIIGVTGTKGKGTTSTLIAKMLEASGKRVHLGGNIGVPALELLKDIQADDWVVLELSSFQLIDLKYSPCIAVCLMVVPEHLNWHADMAEYIAAKSQLFAHQTETDIAIFYSKNETSHKIAAAGNGQKLPYYESPGATIDNGAISISRQEICKTDELKLLGEHNWQNVCAAVTTTWQIAQNTDAMRSVLTTFSGLPHRLEFVREVNGIKYYDDSFGTTPETAIVALQAFKEPKVAILGGSDKGADFAELAKAVTTSNVRHVIAIGNTGKAIQNELARIGYTNVTSGLTTMNEIVATATSQAHAGDIVLLSTGCASFGLFKNYKDRGNQFKQAVQAHA